VISVRLLGDDIRHAPRRWQTSPDFPGLEAELAAGAPMEHPQFLLGERRGPRYLPADATRVASPKRNLPFIMLEWPGEVQKNA
jgi:hypothetical protein